KVDLPHNPAASAVAAFVESQREPDETVVVYSPTGYLPLRYHLGDTPGWVVQEGKPNFWLGWAAIRAEEGVTGDQLPELQGQRLWVVEMRRNNKRQVGLPAEWVARRQVRFPDTYGFKQDFVVIEYERCDGITTSRTVGPRSSAEVNLPGDETNEDRGTD